MSYMQTYSYELHPGQSVLNVLNTIGRMDPTLRFDHCCDGACCGLCAVRCNGRPGLACRLPAQPDMVVAPLAGLPVQEDLVTDRDGYDRARQGLKLYPASAGTPETPIAYVDDRSRERVKTAARCVECLSCLSACPVFRKESSRFAGPCHFALIARHIFDPRDETERREVLRSMNPQLCIQCGRCSEVCPADAQPAKLIAMLCQRLKNGTIAEDHTSAGTQ